MPVLLTCTRVVVSVAVARARASSQVRVRSFVRSLARIRARGVVVMVVSRMRHTALAESNVLGEERKVCVAREAEKQQHGRERRAECRCAAWCAASCHGAPHTRGRDIRPWRMMGESTTDCLTSRAGTPAQAHAQRGGRPRSGVQRDGSGSGWSVRIQRSSSSEEQQRDAKKTREDKSEAELTESRERAEERRGTENIALRNFPSASRCTGHAVFSLPLLGFSPRGLRFCARSPPRPRRSLAARALAGQSRACASCPSACVLAQHGVRRILARLVRPRSFVRSLSFACLFALAATSSARRR